MATKNMVVLSIALFAALFLAACTPQEPAAPATEPVITDEPEPAIVQEPEDTGSEKELEAVHRIELRASGFTPRTLRIAMGDTVTFANMDSKPRRPASNVHPLHTVYPGTHANKCLTAEEGSIFDACRGLEQGEEYSFTFEHKSSPGGWPYHDHLQPSMGGTIIVE